MKNSKLFSKLQLFILTVLASFMSFAQSGTPDIKVDVNVKKPGDSLASGDWMHNPLFWVIGALVLIIIVALVARGGGRKD